MFADRLANHGAELAAVPSEIYSKILAVESLAWKVQARLSAVICALPPLAPSMKQTAPGTGHAVVKSDAEIVQTFGGIQMSGSKGTFIHDSHRVAHKRGIVWCWKCGKYATVRGRCLLKKCS